jgi:hypothetical protein
MSKLGALDRAMVALRFHGAKGDGLCVSKADDRLVVETNPSDAGMSVPGVFADFTVIRRGRARDVGEGLREGKRDD